MLQPKRTKYRKPHNVSYEGKAKGNSYVAFGQMGLMATKGNWITAQQIEAARVSISKFLEKTGKMWIRIYPQMAKTKKPLEVRMGSGKGNPEQWVAVVKDGTIMFEISGLPEETMIKALSVAGHKLAVTWKIVRRDADTKGVVHNDERIAK